MAEGTGHTYRSANDSSTLPPPAPPALHPALGLLLANRSTVLFPTPNPGTDDVLWVSSAELERRLNELAGACMAALVPPVPGTASDMGVPDQALLATVVEGSLAQLRSFVEITKGYERRMAELRDAPSFATDVQTEVQSHMLPSRPLAHGSPQRELSPSTSVKSDTRMMTEQSPSRAEPATKRPKKAQPLPIEPAGQPSFFVPPIKTEDLTASFSRATPPRKKAVQLPTPPNDFSPNGAPSHKAHKAPRKPAVPQVKQQPPLAPFVAPLTAFPTHIQLPTVPATGAELMGTLGEVVTPRIEAANAILQLERDARAAMR
ncbi:hypothetical protein DFJ74DRAFT_675292 [Hyaloraphidium curvatum]|nr:hypothetical protein DFJ74DRAFT_675292 [Hyaloraphidium curvatum]